MADDRRRDDARPGDPAEGVRIIGAEEAAEAFERGDVAERRGTHLPRYGDRPARPPAGPKPALRFPLAADDDAETPSLRPAKGKRFDPRPPPAWDEPDLADTDEGDPWPAESTWGEAAWDDDPQADVVAWTRGETGAQPVVPSADAPAAPGLSWAEDFVDDDDPWDGSWDEPTGAVRWADDEVEPAGDVAPADDPAPLVDPPVAEAPSLEAPAVDLGAPAPLDVADASGPAPDDDWSAFGSADDEPKRGRGLFSRLRSGGAPAEPPAPAPAPDPPAVADDGEPDEVTQVVDLTGAPDLAPDEPDQPDEPDDAELWAPQAASGDDDPGDDDAVDGALVEEPFVDEPFVDDPDPDDEAVAVTDDETDADETRVDAPLGDDGGDDVVDEGIAAWGEPSWGADAVSVGDHARDESSSPLFDADGGWAGDEDGEKVFDFGDEPSGQVALPHWTEPGTGELPRILAGDDDDAVVAGTSGSTPAVHWRSHDGAWAGGDGFADLTDDDDVQLGAMDLDRPMDEELYAFDELDDVGSGAAAPAPPPSGDEPGSRRIAPARPVPEDEPAPAGGGAGRNLGVALAVGLGAAAVALGALAVGSAVTTALVVVILVVGMGEYQAAAQRAGYHPASLLGLVAAAAYPIAVYVRGIEAYPVLIVVTLAAAMAWHLVGADGDARVVESVGVTLFGVAWIAGLGSFAALLLAQTDGRGMLILAVVAAVGYDVGGLLVGRTMGTRPISDASPNKTLEGLFGGMVISFIAVFIVGGMFGLAPWDSLSDAAKIGLFAMLAAPFGDLCESLVKRDLGVKDMGNLLPEHGGILDRFDGLLFVLPTVFFAAMFFGLAPF